MISARQAWQRAFIGQIPTDRKRLWGKLYYAMCRVERMSAWLKVYAWRRSIR